MLKHDFNEKLDRRNTRCWKWDYEGKMATYPMGVADTDFRIAKPIADTLHRKIDEGALAYGAGPQEFFESVSSYYRRRHDFNIPVDNIKFAPGLMVALKLFCDAYTMPGDMVILQPPVYHSFRITVEKAGRHVIENPLKYDEETNTYSVDFEDLEEKAKNPRAKMMVVCNPANPACKAFKKEELERIFEICHRNGVLLISDEVHSDIYYDGETHTPILKISKEAYENAILMSADGKTFNIHGFYTSFVMIPNEKLRAQYELAYEYHHFDYSVMGCLAAEVAYSGECDYYVDGLIEYLQENRDYLVKFLKENDIKVSMANPQATYLMWLDFRKWGMNSQQVYDLMIEYGVGMSKGAGFGTGGDGFMRLNIACHKDTLVAALDCVKKAYEEVISVK